MNLFIAGVGLLALLFASYSRRGLWVACCSTAISVAALSGWAFLPTLEDPTQVRAGLNWVAAQLPLVLNQKTLKELTSAIQQASTSSRCALKEWPACMAAASEPAIHEANVARGAPLSSGAPQAMQAASTASWLEPKRDSKETSRSPVSWLLEDQRPPVSSGIADGFLISGINVSDGVLQDVHGTLKPDSSQRELGLALKVEGHEIQDGAVIPAGARFTLGLESLNSGSPRPFEGGIFTFRYVYAGQERASILYLTQSMIAPPRAAANSE